MKRTYYIVTFVSIWMFVQGVSSQERIVRQRRTTPESQQQQPPVNTSQSSQDLLDLSVSARQMNERQTQQIGNAPWIREIYRVVNLTEEENMPLYYPSEPIEGRMNLFTLLFKLMSENKITVYKYLEGKEIFTDKYKENFDKAFLDRLHIYYTEKKSGAETSYGVEDVDIPSSEVLSYLIKESHYFNPSNSTVDVKILAICPMRVDESEMTREPIFWVPYENIRPYISQSLIMTSNANNALKYSIDDFFRKRMFKGEIIKTTNMMNYTLAQQYPDTASLRYAQDSIEARLKTFERDLWTSSNDMLEKVDKKSTTTESQDTKETKVKTSKPKATKQSSPSAERSVRRR